MAQRNSPPSYRLHKSSGQAVVRWSVQGEGGLGAIRGLKTVSELAALHKVHPTEITLWKKQLLEGVMSVFESPSAKTTTTNESSAAELYEQIGRLKVERDWLKKVAEYSG